MTVQNFAYKQPFALDLLLQVPDFCRIPHAGLELTLSSTTASPQRESSLERKSIQRIFPRNHSRKCNKYLSKETRNDIKATQSNKRSPCRKYCQDHESHWGTVEHQTRLGGVPWLNGTGMEISIL